MPDDESPDNVLQIRPGQPPPTPAPPAFEAAGTPVQAPGHIRTSAFDAPLVPLTPDLVPATFRSDGLPDRNPRPGGGDAGPPATGALSMAAVLAIALAAFEGLRTWLQESGPRRAETAKHQREVELLAAKADADAARYAAQAGHERAKASAQRGRPQSGAEYGRSTLGGRSGATGRGGSTTGAGGPRKAPSSLNSGSSGGRTGKPAGTGVKPGSGPKAGGGVQPSGPKPNGSVKPGGGTKPGGGVKPGGTKPGAKVKPDENGTGGSGTGSSASRGGKTTGSGGPKPAGGLAGWWQRRTGKNDAEPGKNTPASGKGAAAGTGKNSRTSLKGAAGKAMRDRWNARAHLHPFKPKPKPDGKHTLGKANPLPKDNPAGGKGTGTTTPPGTGRTTFWQAVGESAQQRWNKRRAAGHHTRRNNPPHNGPETPDADTSGGASPGGPGANPGGPGPKHGSGPGGPGAKHGGPDPKQAGPHAKPGTGGPEDGFTAWGPRSSPFEPGPETTPDPPPTITVERADGGPGGTAKPKPSGPPAGVTTGKRALPRAPQRPAGKRPGTTRRRDPFAMEPVRTSVGAPARTAPQHATEINLDQALALLNRLVNEGFETHEDCNDLAAGARKLMGALDEFAKDLAGDHNVTDSGLHQELAQVVEIVANLLFLARQMSKDALAAAELAESCEYGMNRDYRPISQATADAGLHLPSAAVHNEN